MPSPSIAAFSAVQSFPFSKRFTRGGVTPDDRASAAGNEVDEAPEGELIGVEIGVDIRVVELERGDDEIVGLIVEEFRGFIPIGAIVLVAFEDEFRTAPEAVAFAEILGDTADEEIWVFSCYLEDPGEHGRGGSFAVRAGDNDGVFAGEELLFEDLRK